MENSNSFQYGIKCYKWWFCKPTPTIESTSVPKPVDQQHKLLQKWKLGYVIV